MNNFLITLKYGLMNSLAINKLRKKTDKSKFSFLKIILLVFLVLILFLISFFYVYIFADAFNTIGQPEMVLSIGIFIGFIFSFLMTITNATGYLFKSKDFDLLMSLPIESKTIVATKLVYLLLINYIVFAFIYIPTLVVYAIFLKTTPVFWILSFFSFVLTPLLPVAIAVFLAYFLSIIIPKFKYKNLLTIVFSLLFIVLIMVVSFSSSMAAEDPTKFSNNIRKILSWTGEWAYNGMHGNYLEYLYFVLISVIPLIILFRFISLFYLRANTKYSASSSGKTYKLSSLQVKSQEKTLIKKELRRYFNSPMYVLNTIVGPLLSTIFLVIFRFSLEPILEEAGTSLNEFDFFAPIIVAMIVFTLGITSTTASSISIEGKQFWILKSSPITPNQVFLGKIVVNLVITIPFIIINTILSIILFEFQILDLIMIFLIPLVVSLYMSCLGLYVNLLFPRFDHESDVKAVKQSLSVLVTMGIGFISAFLIIGLSVFTLIKTGNNSYVYLVGLLISVLLCLASILLLSKHGNKLYKKIVI